MEQTGKKGHTESMVTAPLKIFCSYGHEDEDIVDTLRTHLSPLRRKNLISDWHDRQIPPGGDWDKEIKAQLDSADIILLIISSDFIASRYCMDVETRRALERDRKGTATVIPIFARQCVTDGLSFAYLQGSPRDRNWLAPLPDQDKAYAEVVEFIKTAVEIRLGLAGTSSNKGPGPRGEIPVKKGLGRSRRLLRASVFCSIMVAVLVAGYYFMKPQPDSVADLLLRQGEYSQAQAHCEDQLQNSQELKYINQCLEITALMLEDQPRETRIVKAKSLRQRYPMSPFPLLVLAEDYSATGDGVGRLNMAEELYQQALEMEPKLSQAHFGLGQIDHLRGNLQAALKHYKQAGEYSPDNRRILHNLASINSELGNYTVAHDQYQQLIKVDETIILPYVELVWLLHKNGSFAEALEVDNRLFNEILVYESVWEEELNRAPWFFPVKEHNVYLDQQGEKEQYLSAQYQLSRLLAADGAVGQGLSLKKEIELKSDIKLLLYNQLIQLMEVHNDQHTLDRLKTFKKQFH